MPEHEMEVPAWIFASWPAAFMTVGVTLTIAIGVWGIAFSVSEESRAREAGDAYQAYVEHCEKHGLTPEPPTGDLFKE